ncbi:MAG: hypothetical protein LH479_00915 [Polaromonas sp.]|nr:hypothetical protein [Polaromonas sp.]
MMRGISVSPSSPSSSSSLSFVFSSGLACRAAALASALLLGACAIGGGKVGMTRDDIVARYGAPGVVLPLASGETRLQYSRQPAGQEAEMIDLDAAGRVVRVRQVLNLNEFSKIRPGEWTRGDVLREFGRPARIEHAGNWDGDILTYRWREHVLNRLFFVFVDRQGRVGRTQQGDEYLEVPFDN